MLKNGVNFFLSLTKVTVSENLLYLNSGRKIRFKARIQVMNSAAGFEQKIYDWKETDSEGVHEQIVVGSDWPKDGAPWYTRYHLTFLE